MAYGESFRQAKLASEAAQKAQKRSFEASRQALAAFEAEHGLAKAGRWRFRFMSNSLSRLKRRRGLGLF